MRISNIEILNKYELQNYKHFDHCENVLPEKYDMAISHKK